MNENMVVLTDSNFETEISRKGDGPLLVDFWATWCAPCRALTPILEILSDEYKGKARIGKLDVDNNPATAAKFGIMSVPTLLLFKDGKVAEQIIGAQSKEAIAGLLRRNIA